MRSTAFRPGRAGAPRRPSLPAWVRWGWAPIRATPSEVRRRTMRWWNQADDGPRQPRWHHPAVQRQGHCRANYAYGG
jgi:hypothetical protein